MNDDMTPDIYKSRTKKKNEAEELQRLGERLLKLTRGQLARMEIPDELRKAISEAREISSFKASSRQSQYIGAIMRDCDPGPILDAIVRLEAGLPPVNAVKTPAGPEQKWAMDIIEDESHLEAFLEQCPSADRQRLRQLRRNALKKQDAKKTKRALRALELALKEMLKS